MREQQRQDDEGNKQKRLNLKFLTVLVSHMLSYGERCPWLCCPAKAKKDLA